MGEYIHSQQVRFSRSPASCGIVEAHHLPADTTGNQMLFAIANELYHKANGRPAAFVLWSDVTGKQTVSRGELLAQAVEETDGVGELFVTTPTINPRTGNTIITWLLTVDHASFRNWYQEEFANRVEV